jgi:hypothetical protein
VNLRFVFQTGLAAVLGGWLALPAQHAPAGPAILANSSDIGQTELGDTAYSTQTGVYVLTGGGADMWGTADAFHFAWTRFSGDGSITADARFVASYQLLRRLPGDRGRMGTANVRSEAPMQPLAKAVLIFRQSLDPGSPYADVAIHADGHITLQYRTAAGGKTLDITAAEHGGVRLRIERAGNQFTAYASSADGRMTSFATLPIPLDDPIYAGIGVCAHNVIGLTTASFSNVSIDRAARPSAPARR